MAMKINLKKLFFYSIFYLTSFLCHAKDFPEQIFWKSFFEHYGHSFFKKTAHKKISGSKIDSKKTLMEHINSLRFNYQKALRENKDSSISSEIQISIIEADILLELLASQYSENRSTYLDRFSSHIPSLEDLIQNTPIDENAQNEMLFYASWISYRMGHKNKSILFWKKILHHKQKTIHSYIGCLVAADYYFADKNYAQAKNYYQCTQEGIDHIARIWPSSWKIWLDYRQMWNHYRNGSLQKSQKFAETIIESGRELLDPDSYQQITEDATDIISESILESEFSNPGFLKKYDFPRENPVHGRWMYLLADKLHSQGQNNKSLFIIEKINQLFPMHPLKLKVLITKLKALESLKLFSNALKTKEEIAAFLTPNSLWTSPRKSHKDERSFLIHTVENLANGYMLQKGAFFQQAARGYFESLLALKDSKAKHSEWLLKIAKIHNHLNMYDQAIKNYRQIIQQTTVRHPDYFKALYGIIKTFEKKTRQQMLHIISNQSEKKIALKDLKPLLNYTDQIIALYPHKIESIESIHLTASLLQENQFYNKSSLYWRQSLSYTKTPHFKKQSVRHLIQIYAEIYPLEKQLEYIEDFITMKKVISIGPEFSSEIGIHLSKIAEKISTSQFENGQWLKASRTLERLVLRHKSIHQRSKLSLRAMNYLSLRGDWKKTIDLGKKIESLLSKKDHASWHLVMGKSHQFLLQFEISMKYYKNFVQKFPKHSQIKRALKQLIFLSPAAGKELEAAKYSNLLAKYMDHKNPQKIFYQLKASKIYMKLKDYKNALKTLQNSSKKITTHYYYFELQNLLSEAYWKNNDTSSALKVLHKNLKNIQKSKNLLSFSKYHQVLSKNLYTTASIHYERSILMTETSGWNSKIWSLRNQELFKARQSLEKMASVKDLSWRIKAKFLLAEFSLRQSKELAYHTEHILKSKIITRKKIETIITKLKSEAQKYLNQCADHLYQGTDIHPTQFAIALHQQVQQHQQQRSSARSMESFSLPDPMLLGWPSIQSKTTVSKKPQKTRTKHATNF